MFKAKSDHATSVVLFTVQLYFTTTLLEIMNSKTLPIENSSGYQVLSNLSNINEITALLSKSYS